MLTLQLQKLIGKVKTEKYGKRIIELIEHYLKCEQVDDDVPGAASGSKTQGNKKQKKKHTVLIESSEEEQWYEKDVEAHYYLSILHFGK